MQGAEIVLVQETRTMTAGRIEVKDEKKWVARSKMVVDVFSEKGRKIKRKGRRQK